MKQIIIKTCVFILSFSVATTPAFAGLPEGEITHKTEEVVKAGYNAVEISQVQEQIIKYMQEKFEQIDNLDTDNEVKEAQKIYLVLKIAQNFESKDDKLFQKSIEKTFQQEQEKVVKTGDNVVEISFEEQMIQHNRKSKSGFYALGAFVAIGFTTMGILPDISPTHPFLRVAVAVLGGSLFVYFSTKALLGFY